MLCPESNYFNIRLVSLHYPPPSNSLYESKPVGVWQRRQHLHFCFSSCTLIAISSWNFSFHTLGKILHLQQHGAGRQGQTEGCHLLLLPAPLPTAQVWLRRSLIAPRAGPAPSAVLGAALRDRLSSPRPRCNQHKPVHSHQKGNSNLPTFMISFFFFFFFSSLGITSAPGETPKPVCKHSRAAQA